MTVLQKNDRDVTFAETFDVVVVGYGFAGAFAAIAAADAGAKVLVLEKAAIPGGISLCSYGSVRSAHDPDKAFAYLKQTNAGRIPDAVLRRLADGMAGVEEQVRGLAAVNGSTVKTRESEGNYPFEGTDTFYDTLIVDIPGVPDCAELYPNLSGSRAANGWRLFKVLEDNVAKRAIEVRFERRAERLIVDETGAVTGLHVRGPSGEAVAIAASRGIVLACGGFEADPSMKEQYWQKQPVLAAATVTNTGDGIRMAQDLGADLWHMWHYHGSYGFRHPDPDVSLAIRAKRLPDWMPGREDEAKVGMSWIIVDQDGRRYMNECEPYAQDTTHRPMEYYDTARQIFPRIPSHMIFDERSRSLYPVGIPTFNAVGVSYDWSPDNLREVENGLLKKAENMAELAAILGMEETVLRDTLDRWNAACRAGHDGEFGRPKGTMVPVETAPFYVGSLWPVVSNTQGGPVHDERQRILDVYGEPIPRLYEAGELGSAFGFLYLAGGNLAECAVGGAIAGREAASLSSRIANSSQVTRTDA